MQYSYNTWALGSFPAWLPSFPLEHVIDRLAALGYDGIELGAAAPHAFPAYLPPARREALRSRLDAAGLVVSGICPAIGGGAGYNPVSPDDPERAAWERYFVECLDLCRDLGCERMIFLGGYRRYGQSAEDAWSRAVDALARAAGHAAERGVDLVVEPTPADSNVVDSVGDALRLIDAAGAPAGVMFDTYHVFHRLDEHADVIAQCGERLAYVHLSDRGRDAPGTHEDFGQLYESLVGAGYDGWLTMEIGFDRRSSDPFTLARVALEHLRSVEARRQ